ncbi:hypothetical protein [Flavobacterium ichthyis]|nr:hypothetical protein [Flavobacterium ichthyis]
MKTTPLFAIVGGLFLAVACSSDDDSSSSNNPTPTQVTNTVTSGTWRITSYLDNGQDETYHFTNYNFNFAANNVLTANNGTNNYSGIWSVTNDDSDDDSPSNDVDFNILFSTSTPASFQDLTDDWDILEITNSKIRLRDVSGGDGDTDFLTFEKN